MGKISSKFSPPYAKRWYREPKSLYTDTQFDSLFSFVRSEVQRLRVRVVVINNAHLLDGCALEMLMLLRKHCHNQLSIVLCAQLAEKADLDEPLAEAFKRATEAAESCKRVELQRLTKKEYKRVVLPSLTQELNLSLLTICWKRQLSTEFPTDYGSTLSSIGSG